MATRCGRSPRRSSQHRGHVRGWWTDRGSFGRLTPARMRALTLVAAPPGFGKSTAVRTWCADRSAAYAWVTLDARDNDPVRLWTYIATAVDRIRPSLGRATLRRLRAAGDVAARDRRAAERDRRPRGRSRARPRRHADRDGQRVPRVARLCHRAPPRERAHGRDHAHRSSARPGAAACRWIARRAARGRARIHDRRGARTARRTRRDRPRRR